MITNSLLSTLSMETLNIDPYSALACAVIRQTVNDALLFKRYVKRPSKNKYKDIDIRNQIGDAEEFILSNKLDKYLTFMNLGLSPDYIRKVYMKLVRQDAQKGVEMVFN